MLLQVKKLPDFELSKNREKGITPVFIAENFESMNYSIISYTGVKVLDYVFIAHDEELKIFIKVEIEEKFKDSLREKLLHNKIGANYSLHDVNEELLNEVYNRCCEACFVTNSKTIIEKTDIIKFFDQKFDDNRTINTVYDDRLLYQKFCTFNNQNDYSFISDLILNKDVTNGFIVRIYNRAVVPNNYMVDAHHIIQQILQYFKIVESYKTMGAGFDSPIKELYKPASEWIKKLFESYSDTNSVFYDILFFTSLEGNAQSIANMIMSYISENRNFILNNIEGKPYEYLINKKKIEHSFLGREIELIVRELRSDVSNIVFVNFLNEKLKNESFKRFLYDYAETLRPIAEIMPLCRFVIPTHGGIKGINSESFPEIENNGIYLGKNDETGRKVYLPLKNLTKNMFIAGAPGSGKTTVLLNLLTQLLLNKKSFLCFEPVKTEFRSLLASELKKELSEEGQEFLDELKSIKSKNDIGGLKKSLRIYTPGNNELSPFYYNPFIVPEGITIEEHIKSLLLAFEGAISMIGPIPGLFRSTLINLYTNIEEYKLKKEIKQEGIFDNLIEFELEQKITKEDVKEISFPTIKQFVRLLNVVVNEQYKDSNEVRGNVKSWIDTRISVLTELTMGRIFNTQKNSFGKIADLLDNNVIFEMDALKEDEANLITMFILAQLRNFIKKKPLNANDLKHLIILEEAHNIVGIDTAKHEEGSSNPKEVATKFITKMMAEVRSYGYGFCISDQFPTAVQPMVVRNTSSKIAHRVISKEDKERLANSMLITESQQETLTAFSPGQSFVFMEGWLKPLKINEPHFKEYFSIEKDFDNSTIKNIINNEKWFIDSIKISKEIEQMQYEEKNLNKKLEKEKRKVLFDLDLREEA